jgi:hypothetical protein
MNTFTDTAEARNAVEKLRIELYRMPYNADLRRVLNNLDSMVSEMSKFEVEARRTHCYDRVVAAGDKVFKAHSYLQHVMLMARLVY